MLISVIGKRRERKREREKERDHICEMQIKRFLCIISPHYKPDPQFPDPVVLLITVKCHQEIFLLVCISKHFLSLQFSCSLSLRLLLPLTRAWITQQPHLAWHCTHTAATEPD